MPIYIQSSAAIAPATHPASKQEPFALRCAEPDLTGIVDPKQSRRMSHVIKMGIAAAMQALQITGLQKPDAIVTGTAYGCLDDTGVFLKKQVQQQETMLTPTAFIQSTHNTVGGQIGLMIGCNGYNNTFVHRGFSFEHALQDAMMLLEDGEAATVLAGAVDEITDTSHTLLSRFRLYENGGLAGEGGAFFVLGKEAGINNKAVLQDVSTLYKPADAEDIRLHIMAFLAKNALQPQDIGMVLTGTNADASNNLVYNQVLENLLPNATEATLKADSGDYPTATSYALHKAVTLLEQSDNQQPILIYNHYRHIHHSFILITPR